MSGDQQHGGRDPGREEADGKAGGQLVVGMYERDRQKRDEQARKAREAMEELMTRLPGMRTSIIQEWFELPSAGDTSYAGGVELKDGSWFFSWYSGSIPLDEPWLTGMLDATDIWTGTVAFK